MIINQENIIMPMRTDAITRFLIAFTHPDLASLYNSNMEVQVNVAQDDGEPIEGDYKGRIWRGYSNGLETWKPLRIPWNAKTEPEYTDSEMTWNLEAHTEAIGMTGWDWGNRLSRWVAFDFDSLINHKEGLTQDELNGIITNLKDIEWVSIRRSTSGTGLHIYVFLEPVPTKNHCEHSALARAILGKLSAIAAFDFRSKVDSCGGNMWVWHRKMKGTNGLTLIKDGRPMTEDEVPVNWQDHIKIVSSPRKAPTDKISSSNDVESLAQQRTNVLLDSEHKRLITYLEETGAFWWWDQDMNMLVTHTHWIRKAHIDLNLKGIFETSSAATNVREQNCFLFAMKNGAWSVRRYTPGVQEHSTWHQDGQGWTRCYLNKDPDLPTVAKMFGGIEDKKSAFSFREAELGIKAAEMMGAYIDIPPALRNRHMTIAIDKRDDRKINVEIKREATDLPLNDWIAEKNTWFRKYYIKTQTVNAEPDITDFDDSIRHLVTSSQEDYGWAIFTDNEWRFEPLTHVKSALGAMNYDHKDTERIIGSAILRPWRKVNRPLQPEYPGSREWNMGAAQLAFSPSTSDSLNYPTWTQMLKHCGSGLDDALVHNAWAKANGIKNGGDYLKVWVASLLQYPNDPLPYLFFHGDQDVGKSILHEAIAVLLTKGCQRADAALMSASAFNAELEDAILCIVEETELQANKQAYNRIKDWVTARELLIHRKGSTPYHIPNTSHWMQCANSRAACPVFPGDTRITMCWVQPLDPLSKIPKNEFIEKLKKEAPDFLAEVLNLEVPTSNDRLRVPVIITSDKLSATESNMTPLERFLKEHCHYVPGKMIKYSEFYAKFKESVDPNEAMDWSQIRVGKNLPPQFPKGRLLTDGGQYYIGNISFSEKDDMEPELSRLMLISDKLMPCNTGA